MSKGFQGCKCISIQPHRNASISFCTIPDFACIFHHVIVEGIKWANSILRMHHNYYQVGGAGRNVMGGF
jgi:hypothetical protein